MCSDVLRDAFSALNDDHRLDAELEAPARRAGRLQDAAIKAA